MSQYGTVAILATKLFREGEADTPKSAWIEAARRKISNKNSRNKGCPKGAYLGLCAADLVRGVPPGDYVKPESKEKKYVIAAVDILKEDCTKKKNISNLWKDVLMVLRDEDLDKGHDQQMNVVVALWDNGDIKK